MVLKFILVALTQFNARRFRPFVKGNLASESLSRANITCNKNGIPFDSESPMITSGIRLELKQQQQEVLV